MPSARPDVYGVDLDAQTRCAHYWAEFDIIAIKLKCCGLYCACKECHDALAAHSIEIGPQPEWNQLAVLCGACGHEMTIEEYMASSYRYSNCRDPLNPGCRKHYPFYFATSE